MPETFTTAERSAIMRRVKSSATTPEREVLEILRGLRRRPAVQVADLPGKPDFVFVRAKAAIFVHGCFWHRHTCRSGRTLPVKNQDYWLAKLERNRRRDRRVRRELRALGYRVLVIWGCQTGASRRERLAARLERFLAG